MEKFEQVRCRQPIVNCNWHIVVACPPMKSNCNVSMLARTASCMGGQLTPT